MSSIKFTINGKNFEVFSSIEGSTSLNSFIRNVANLRGTKVMCEEGGCGACIVSVMAKHPVTKKDEIFSVNSCLVSILSCHGWAITTVEGIGNKKIGYHLIQDRLASFNGTQCGYCSPGWVMNMYSLHENNKGNLTMKQVENSFAGNMCRCTGYRPIMDAFKSFAKDAPPHLLNSITDIEDLSKFKICEKDGRKCPIIKNNDDFITDDDFCLLNANNCHESFKENNTKTIQLTDAEVHWYKVYSLKDLFDVFDKHGTDSYTFVAGNTGQGVFHRPILPRISIDIAGIPELRKHAKEANLVLGAGMGLNEMMELFLKIAKDDIYFEYLLQMYKHMDLVAHVPVRNIGTIGGNLSLKHQNNEFQSDVFLLFETVNASITIAEKPEKTITISMPEYLKLDMRGKVITAINLPPLSDSYVFKSYKIMPRAQNAHAHVNAGFLFKFNSDKSSIENVNIVYGGINPNFIHAEQTEKLLVGKNIFEEAMLQRALKSLYGEINPNEAPPEPSPKFRRQLAVNLFYKCILSISPPKLVNPRNKSGGEIFDRPVSSGKQDFSTNKNNWPINKPVKKIEAIAQTSGEAKFVNDHPSIPNELFAAFVVSTVAIGEINEIKSEEILMKKGVVALYTAKDIPGSNNFTPPFPPLYIENEEILCSGKIKYYGQPVAIILAENEKLARVAATEVRVTYKNVPKTPPTVMLRDAMKDKKRIIPSGEIKPKSKGNDIQKVIKGSFDIYGQYHYTMETLSCVCIPIEDGMDVYPSSQGMDLTQRTIGNMLNIPENSINVNVRRLGGAYGIKISRGNLVAAGCALAAYKSNKPVRFVLPIMTNMLSVGKRLPLSGDYEVGVDNNGLIQYLEVQSFEDGGCSPNENIAALSLPSFLNVYDGKNYHIEANLVLTDTPSNTWCRAPGTTEAVAMIENIMEHIAVELDKDPLEVRLSNLNMDDKNPIELISSVKESSDFTVRKNNVKIFNENNKWKKRGISLTPLKYDLDFFGTWYSMISVYYGDGTVSVTHGGIEMGQGLNTKVAQVCAHSLGIPMDMISIKPSNNFVAPNNILSGGSVSSDSCCFATLKAAEMILQRLAPIKKQMGNPTWIELIGKAYQSGVDLCAHYYHTPLDGIQNYAIYGATVIEVEVDLLTGNHHVVRVDILEDAGESISPLVDIGQVEGAFIMGLGYYTSENLIWDKKTGALLTTRTWNYKPPGVKDIPIDFRVAFRKDSPNKYGILRSKATGEPPLNMAFSIVTAIREAITSLRMENGFSPNEWYTIELPATTESILMATETKLENMTLW